ncbi:porin family protein [Aquimarina spongiae]
MAQVEKIRFGGKAGVNLSEIRGSTDYRTSFHVGVLTEIPVLNKISVQPELVYSSQGGETVTSDFEAIFKLDYLNIPVMLQLCLGKSFNFQVGPRRVFTVCQKRSDR